MKELETGFLKKCFYSPNIEEGSENYINKLKSNKVKSGAGYRLADMELGWAAMQADHKGPL